MDYIKNLKEYGFNTHHKVFVIAEIGINHGGNVEKAKLLIDSAVRAGVDAVKFQTYLTEKRVEKDSPLFDILKKCELPFDAFRELKEYSNSKNVIFFSTPFDEESIEYLESIHCDIYKISSFDVANQELLNKVALTSKPIIMSVGMSSLDEIKIAYGILSNKTSNIALLHCISSYPTDEEDACLANIFKLKQEFDCIIGQSDHTSDIKVPLYAVAAGAQIIEKHYKIDDQMECVDSSLSITEFQMHEMIDEIRFIEGIFGNSRIGMTDAQRGSSMFRRITKHKVDKHLETKINKYGFYSLTRKPSLKELENYYSEHYFQNETQGYQHSYSQEEIDYINNKISQKRIQAEILRGIKQGNFLDIGAGEGWALKNFYEAGYIVEGIEFSRYAINNVNPKYINSVLIGNVYDIIGELVDKNKKYDIILLDNVLEHLLAPESLLANIKKLMNDDSVMIIEVPNDFSPIQEYLINNSHIKEKYWVKSPEHISYFNISNLKKFLLSRGFSIESVIGDYPIEFDLLVKNTNYIINNKVGKNSHLRRIRVENYLHSIDPVLTNELYAVYAKMGIGRDVSIFVKKLNGG